MSEDKPPKPRSYIAEICHESWQDVSLAEIIAECVVGIMLPILATRYGVAQRNELLELFFLCIGSAIFIPLLAFAFRMIFISPYRLNKSLKVKNQELNSQLDNRKSTKANLEITPKLIPAYDAQHLFIFVHNAGPTYAQEVEVKLEKIACPLVSDDLITSRLGRRGTRKDQPNEAISDINCQGDDAWILLSSQNFKEAKCLTIYILPVDVTIPIDKKKSLECELWVSVNAKNALSRRMACIKLTVSESGEVDFTWEYK
jgi:hypothetical protein